MLIDFYVDSFRSQMLLPPRSHFFFFIVVQGELSPCSRHHIPLPHPPPTHLNPTLLWLCPWALYRCSLTTLPLLSLIIPLSQPLWLLSVCSLFPCLWFYFACLFCLWKTKKTFLIRWAGAAFPVISLWWFSSQLLSLSHMFVQICLLPLSPHLNFTM